MAEDGAVSPNASLKDDIVTAADDDHTKCNDSVPGAQRTLALPAIMVVSGLSLSVVLHVVAFMTEKPFPTDALSIFHTLVVIVPLIQMVRFMHESRSQSVQPTAATRIFHPDNVRLFILWIHTVGCSGYFLIRLIIGAKCLNGTVSTEIIVSLVSNVAMFVFCVVQFAFLRKNKTMRFVKNVYPFWLFVNIVANTCNIIDSMFSSSVHITKLGRTTNVATIPCKGETGNWIAVTTEILHKLVFGYCLLSLGYLCRLWEKRFWQTRTERQSEEQTLGFSISARLTRRERLCTKLTELIVHTSRWSFYISLVLSVSVFTLYFVSSIHNHVFDNPTYMKPNETDTLTAVSSYTESTYYYTMAIVAFFGFLLARVDKNHDSSYAGDELLLLVGIFAHVTLILFQTVSVLADFAVDSMHDTRIKVSFTAKVVSHMLGVFCQSYIILKYSAQEQVVFRSKNRRLYVRAIVVFLGVSNVLIFVRDTVLPPLTISFLTSIHRDVFGFESWWYILQAIMPVVGFYRVQSALLCYKVALKLSGDDFTHSPLT